MTERVVLVTMCAQIQRMTEDETETAVPQTDTDEKPTAPAEIMEALRPGEVARAGEVARPGKVARPKEVALPTEFGGPKGPEPTRYGDWEQKGRCTDF